jgi:uncharacterized membrane protein
MKLFRNLRNLQILSLVLAAIGVADSAYLWWTKLSHTEIICGVGECDVVNASPYASLLGIPVAALGVAGYGALLIAAVWVLVRIIKAPTWMPNARFLMACGGLFFAAYLTAIELFVIHAI